jgi:predicted transcriptional regulator
MGCCVTAITKRAVSEIMSAPVLTIELSDSLWDAWQLLSVSGLRYLVVLGRDNECLGLISDRQILAEIPATADHLGAISVIEAMGHGQQIFLSPTHTPQEAAALMRKHDQEAMPVCTPDGKIAGILTHADLVKWIS